MQELLKEFLQVRLHSALT